MKKTLVSALTGALVMGAAATTFAAANPFADVAADHWAYDAIAQLAADGVVEGYGDGTFRGDQEITRYEMAQMVARAMAKGNLTTANKAIVDKLAAEFSDELNNLGVRVAALEKKVDNTKFYGLFRYTYNRTRHENNPNHENTNDFRLRLQTAHEINKNWTGHARIEYKSDMNSAVNGQAKGSEAYLNRVYVEGKYGNTVIDLGKFPVFSTIDGGMTFDDQLAGGMVTFGKKVTAKIFAGRWNADGVGQIYGGDKNGTASVWGVELATDPTKKLSGGIAYYHLANGAFANDEDKNGEKYNKDSANIWDLGLTYRFDKNVALSGAYAWNTAGEYDSALRKAWSVELDYKGADLKKAGSYGLFLAYRSLGGAAVILPTYNSMGENERGWTIGGKVTLVKNVFGILEYTSSKDLKADKDDKIKTIFARVEAYF